jgi:hypothetical protein
VANDEIVLDCADGSGLILSEAYLDGERLTAQRFTERYGTGTVPGA